MPEFAPLFTENGSVLPKNTSKMASRLTREALVATTVGAVAGTTTTSTKQRIKHNAGNAVFESKPVLEANPQEIARASTAADVTAMKAQLGDKRPSLAFPADRSGNGGRAFTRV